MVSERMILEYLKQFMASAYKFIVFQPPDRVVFTDDPAGMDGITVSKDGLSDMHAVASFISSEMAASGMGGGGN